MSQAPAAPHRAVLALARLELTLTLRRGESVLIAFLIPLLLLVFFSFVPVGGSSAGGLDFLVPGVIALAIMSSGLVSLGIATAFERYYGVLKLLGGMPISRLQLLLAKLLAVLVLQAIQVALIGLVAVVLLGWRPDPALPRLLLALALGSAAFSTLGLLLAGALRAEATLAAANGLYLVLLLLGDMVFPLAALPAWLAGAARLLPAAAFAEATRAAFQRGATDGAALAILALWTAGALLLASRTFRWE